MASELLSPLNIFGNSTKCINIWFDLIQILKFQTLFAGIFSYSSSSSDAHDRGGKVVAFHCHKIPSETIHTWWFKIVYAFGGLWHKKCLTDIKMKMLLSVKAYHEEILFGKITHHLDPKIWKMLTRSMFWEQGFLIQFCSVIYLLLRSKFYF